MPLWSGKKAPEEDHVKIEVPSAAGDSAPDHSPLQPPDVHGQDAPDRLEQLCTRLGQLVELLGEANRQVLAYLVDREAKTAASAADQRAAVALAEKIDDVIDKVTRLDAKLGSPGREDPGSSAEDATAPAASIDGLGRQLAALADGLRRVEQRLDAGLEQLADRLAATRPEEPGEPAPAPLAEPVIGPPACSSAAQQTPGQWEDWQQALLGSELAEYPGLDIPRQQLLAGVLQGDPGACSLLGQLLVFRSASSDKMPPLLKDIGEAYYRWQPKSHPGSDPLEQALVTWLKQTMQQAGIANTIELVQPGERFDSTRHTASTRGVEITEVRGWIVLRESGKVYTRANVAVR